MVEPRRWHPLLAAQEGPTGTWSLLDGYDRVYGSIEIRRVNATEVRYRASFQGEVIGWSTTLRLACERVHAEFLRSHGPNGGPIASWGATKQTLRSKLYAASMSSSSRKSSAGSSAAPSSLDSCDVSGGSRGVTSAQGSPLARGPRSAVRSGSMRCHSVVAVDPRNQSVVTTGLIHPEHGAIGVLPGRYSVRRRREWAEVARLVED